MKKGGEVREQVRELLVFATRKCTIPRDVAGLRLIVARKDSVSDPAWEYFDFEARVAFCLV